MNRWTVFAAVPLSEGGASLQVVRVEAPTHDLGIEAAIAHLAERNDDLPESLDAVALPGWLVAGESAR